MYSFKSRVRYSECDAEGRLTIAGLINYIQDTSLFQSESRGVGVARLEEKHRAWFVSFWQIDIERMPVFCEDIVVTTIPYEIKGFYGLRNFKIEDSEGNMIVKVNSVWVYMDTQKGRPVRADDEELEAYKVDDKLDMEYLPRKMKCPEGVIERESVTVSYNMTDSNHHMNNGQYIKLGEDIYKEISFEAGKPVNKVSRILVEYKLQARLNDVIHPFVKYDGESCFIDMRSDEGKSYALVSLQ